MYGKLITLFRGTTLQAVENVTDRHTLTILKQQINDCSKSVITARKAVGMALAQNEQEALRGHRLVAKKDELEERAVHALQKGKENIALEASETIASLEAEYEASRNAQESFLTEIDRLKSKVRKGEIRLKDLKRGYRLAEVTDRVQKLRNESPDYELSSLKDAEDTLQGLRERQFALDKASEFTLGLEEAEDTDCLLQKMAREGCGAPLKASSQEVMERLKQKADSTH